MEPKQQDLWDKHLDAWNQGKVACRFYWIKRFTAEYPENLFGWVSFAISLYSVSRFSESRAALRKAESLSPEMFLDRVFCEVGNLHDRKGNLPRAEIWYRKAVQSSASTRNLTPLGVCLARQGMATEARQNYRKAIETASSEPVEAHYHLGLSLRAEDRYEEALECMEKAVEFDSEHSEAEKAKLDLVRVSEIEPPGLKETESVHRERLKDAWNAWNSGEPACLLRLSRQYTIDNPGNFVGWIYLGNALQELSRFREARAALRRAESICPKKRLNWVFMYVGNLYREKGNYLRAEIWYRKAVESQATTESLIFLGACLARQGRFAEAKRVHHRAAIEIGSTVPDEAYFNLALVLRAEERYEEALECMGKALELDPEDSTMEEVRVDLVEVLEHLA